jgi:hypothetical protein
MTDDLCGCIKCTDERMEQMRRLGATFEHLFKGPRFPGWRYACEKCGNKRCPHHSDHTLECTNSNKSGQPGSVYQ